MNKEDLKIIGNNGKASKIIAEVKEILLEGISGETQGLCEILVKINLLQEDLEMASNALKKFLMENGIEKTVIPEYSSKVTLQEGNDNKVFKLENIADAFHKAGRISDFAKIVKLVQEKVKSVLQKSDPLLETIEANTTIEKGKPYIKVSKLTKQELVESV